MIDATKIIKILNQNKINYNYSDNFIFEKIYDGEVTKVIHPVEKTFIKDIKKNNELIESSLIKEKIEALLFVYKISRLLYPNWKLFQKKEGEIIKWSNWALYLNIDKENIYFFENESREIWIKEDREEYIKIKSFFYIINMKVIETSLFQNLLKIWYVLKKNKINLFDKNNKDNSIILYFLNNMFILNK